LGGQSKTDLLRGRVRKIKERTLVSPSMKFWGVGGGSSRVRPDLYHEQDGASQLRGIGKELEATRWEPRRMLKEETIERDFIYSNAHFHCKEGHHAAGPSVGKGGAHCNSTSNLAHHDRKGGGEEKEEGELKW